MSSRIHPFPFVKTVILSCVLFFLVGCTMGPERKILPTFNKEPVSQRRIDLGKTLFFDKILSHDKTVSCATCHQPEYGFADPVAFSTGVSKKPLARHTPHLFNIFSNSSFFWDGRSPSLEHQALQPIPNEDEMGLPVKEMVKRLKQEPRYVTEFGAVFPRSGVTAKNVGIAIAAFERTIVADNTPFDRFQSGDTKALSASAKRGMDLFFDKKTNCSKCHSGDNFTDSDFHNTGLFGEDLGRATVDRHGQFQMRPYPFFHTQKAFKTPSLRNVSLTAPYMHNGAFNTLEEVIEIYNKGGQDPESYGISLDIKPLSLTQQEMKDLVLFLKEGLLSPNKFNAAMTH
ncbi:MAG: c-type cytochrome [Pseudomonadales bacterium]|nr:c-type cytochrome [Pseudomonadales bacterium]